MQNEVITQGRTIGRSNARTLTNEELAMVSGGAHLTSVTATVSSSGGKTTVDGSATLDF